MVNIVGTLKDSVGNPLHAEVRVRLLSPVVDSSPSPDAIYFPYEAVEESNPATGALSITGVPVTEYDRVSAEFRIRPLSTPGQDLLFYAIVPDSPTVELSDLLPTSFSSDRAASDALRVAKVLLGNSQIAPIALSGLGLVRSDTEPPFQADTAWFDTAGYNLYFAHSGAYYGLGGQAAGSRYDSGSVQPLEMPFTVKPGKGWLLTDIGLGWTVNSPHSATDKWRFRLGYTPIASSTPVWLTSDLSSFSASSHSQTLTTVIAPDTVRRVFIQVEKDGNPGNYSLFGSLRYLLEA